MAHAAALEAQKNPGAEAPGFLLSIRNQKIDHPPNAGMPVNAVESLPQKFGTTVVRSTLLATEPGMVILDPPPEY